MARYIDADDVIYELDRVFPVDDFKKIIRAISRTPTADVVEVVRCKECKYRDDDDFCTGRGYPNALVPDDGFCDKGERRE